MNGGYPLSIRYVPSTGLKLTITCHDMFWLKVLFDGLVPGLTLFGGFGLLYRRKRR